MDEGADEKTCFWLLWFYLMMTALFVQALDKPALIKRLGLSGLSVGIDGLHSELGGRFDCHVLDQTRCFPEKQ